MATLPNSDNEYIWSMFQGVYGIDFLFFRDYYYDDHIVTSFPVSFPDVLTVFPLSFSSYSFLPSILPFSFPQYSLPSLCYVPLQFIPPSLFLFFLPYKHKHILGMNEFVRERETRLSTRLLLRHVHSEELQIFYLENFCRNTVFFGLLPFSFAVLISSSCFFFIIIFIIFILAWIPSSALPFPFYLRLHVQPVSSFLLFL